MAHHTASINPPSVANTWLIGGRSYDLSKAGMIMGIVNVTPDSFSDGGNFQNADAAAEHALHLESEGAAIIDFGGESTRPGAATVSIEAELMRVLPPIERFAALRAEKTLISVDTSKPEVASAALASGADIINDVTGFSDPSMRAIAAGSTCGLVLMHMLGNPRNMQAKPQYDSVLEEVMSYWKQQLDLCENDGIAAERIVLDPGIGFGKSLAHNLELLQSLPEMQRCGRPLLMGVSRKSFIASLVDKEDISHREWPTVALSAYLRQQGAAILRVHDPGTNLQAMRMSEAILFG
ncbi:MAG: dihydropteroate synthase [Verrucomicrobiaceae bacterium]|nr:dihydropteroate synthase [Verrucomicrobiaceae bacterium]